MTKIKNMGRTHSSSGHHREGCGTDAWGLRWRGDRGQKRRQHPQQDLVWFIRRQIKSKNVSRIWPKIRRKTQKSELWFQWPRAITWKMNCIINIVTHKSKPDWQKIRLSIYQDLSWSLRISRFLTLSLFLPLANQWWRGPCCWCRGTPGWSARGA